MLLYLFLLPLHVSIVCAGRLDSDQALQVDRWLLVIAVQTFSLGVSLN